MWKLESLIRHLRYPQFLFVTEIKCPEAENYPVNAVLTHGTTNAAGFELHYSCNDCHEKVDGDTVVKCVGQGTEEGVWEGKPAVCEG